MANLTHLDELVDYPALVIQRLISNQKILDLLANKANATANDLLDANDEWTCFYDYEYIPGTTQEVKAAFLIDTDIVSIKTDSQKNLELYISVLCSRPHMKIDRKILKGYKGNRVNNLIRYADFSLRGDRDFGIGPLQLKSVRTVTAGNSDFAKKTLTYAIPDFNKLRG